MSRNVEETRHRICESALTVIKREGSAGFTIELVAAEARCAKGLIHYHFGTKLSLIAELIRGHHQDRLEKWQKALAAPDAQRAIEFTWELIQSEVGTAELIVGGLGRLDAELVAAFRAADSDFAGLLGDSVKNLMQRTGLEFDVPADQAGGLLSAVINGSLVRLASGAAAGEIQEAYALGWLSLLSLTQPLTDA